MCFRLSPLQRYGEDNRLDSQKHQICYFFPLRFNLIRTLIEGKDANIFHEIETGGIRTKNIDFLKNVNGGPGGN